MFKTMTTAASAAALLLASGPALAKEKVDKDQAKVAASIAKISAEGPVSPVALTWPVGVTSGTPTVAAGATLPSNTEIVLRLNSELTSKKARAGDTFVGSVAQDVMLGNMVVIPRGTPAHGVVTYRTGKGSFGKSAKMNYEFRSIELNGQRLPVSGQFRQEGSGNTGATVGAVAAAGLVGGLFVTGKSAVVGTDRDLRVHTTTAIPVTLPGATASN
jgi:hypothetical protein